MTIEERARFAHGKRDFVVALCVEYYPTGGNDTTRAAIHEAVNDAIIKAVAPFGIFTGIKKESLTK